jgi:hypothetical protein
MTKTLTERADALLKAAKDLLSYEDADNPELLTHGQVWGNLRRAVEDYERKVQR